MNRRKFIYTSGLSAAGLLTGAFAHTGKPEYKMGLQLFTIRAAMAKDPKSTLQKVAALGYEDLETYGFDAKETGFYGMKANDFYTMISDLGLTTSSGHYDLNKFINAPDPELFAYVDQCIAGALAIRHKYITWPWLDPANRSLDTFKMLAPKLNRIGEQVKKAGLGFAYHNHDFEFIDHNGKNGYQVIMEETDPELVKLQMDLYWVAYQSKEPPSYYFKKQPGRFVMWHIKDMDKVTRDYSELGRGSIDYTKILPDHQLSGLQYYFIEQGGNFYTKDAMDSIAESAAFFKKNLRKYL